MSDVKLVLGTMTFGESVFNPDVEKFINEFLLAGYCELDTAYVYNNGDCEKLLGDALKNINKPYKVATKINPRISGKLDADAAYKQLNESLKRLKMESVDTVFLHFPDPATPVYSVLSALQEMYEQGKFKKLGLSNFPAWMVADVWHICDKNGFVKPTVYEGIYNPLTRTAETELNEALTYFGMSFYAYNPLAGGLLTGRYTEFDSEPDDGRFTHRPNYQGRYWKKSYFEAVNVIKEASDKHGLTIIEATYRWLMNHSMLSQERGDAVLIGASKFNHLKQNIDCAKAGPLPRDIVEAFEKAWEITKGDSPKYFTLYQGKGSVGGEKK